jgi:hypothetical protein
MAIKGKNTVVRLPEPPRYDPPHWSDLLREAVKLREAWKLYAIAQREQIERLENFLDEIRATVPEAGHWAAGNEDPEIENARDSIEILRHAVVTVGDGD